MDPNVFEGAMAMAIGIAVVVAFTLGVAAMWGLPKIWMFAKPFIHAITG